MRRSHGKIWMIERNQQISEKSTNGTQLIQSTKMGNMETGDRDVMSRLTMVFKSG